MSKTDPKLLRELEDQARQSGEAFLRNIASRLGREPLAQAPPHPSKGAPDFWNAVELPVGERIARFMRHWELAGGHARRVANPGEAARFIRELVAETGAKRLIRQDEPELAALALDQLPGVEMALWQAGQATEAGKEALLAAAAGADIGIVQADAAVAHTGTIVVSSAPGKGRTVSLLPTILVALVPAAAVKTRLGEMLRPMDELAREERPAGVHFISGPSRSSDIENDLTIGVHGPGIVYALIVESE